MKLRREDAALAAMLRQQYASVRQGHSPQVACSMLGRRLQEERTAEQVRRIISFGAMLRICKACWTEYRERCHSHYCIPCRYKRKQDVRRALIKRKAAERAAPQVVGAHGPRRRAQFMTDGELYAYARETFGMSHEQYLAAKADVMCHPLSAQDRRIHAR